MTTALASGVLLGLSAGPMLALVVAQTLRPDSRESCKIALTPLVTGPPTSLVTLALASKLAELRQLLGIVSIAGGAFVPYLAWESFNPVCQEAEARAEQPGSWFKGIVTNPLSPHPWVFWLTVGDAILAKDAPRSPTFSLHSSCPFVSHLSLCGGTPIHLAG